MYTQKVLEHFRNPHNQGTIADASGVGQVGNPVCGDIMKIYLRIAGDDKENIDKHTITEVKFETLGCGAAIASTSMLTDLIKDKTIGQALKISKQDVVDSLDGLPKPKIHCSILAVDGLKEAVEDYKKKLNNK